MQNYTCFGQIYKDCYKQNSLPLNLHKYQLHLLKQRSESFKLWSANNRINTEGKSLIMK